MADSCLSAIYLENEHINSLPSYIRHEQKRAQDELILHHERFKPAHNDNGPYTLDITLQNGQLVLKITDAAGQPLPVLLLSLTPYRRLIRDYFLMIESYEKARHNESRAKLEAIDMGRRGIHNEGAELLLNRLKDKIDMDFETARKLFTLICVLHHSHMRLVG